MGHCRAIELQVYHSLLLQEVFPLPLSAIVAFLVFDISSLESFEDIQKWMDEVKNNANEHTRLILVGNKSDLADCRAVRREQIQEYCNSRGMTYF